MVAFCVRDDFNHRVGSHCNGFSFLEVHQGTFVANFIKVNGLARVAKNVWTSRFIFSAGLEDHACGAMNNVVIGWIFLMAAGVN